MSYYPREHAAHGDADENFDEYDPTPYAGGYDIDITYGRSLPASAETCYPPSTSTTTTTTSSYGRNDDVHVVDHDRPSYSSYSQPSAYAEAAVDNEYTSYSRPHAQPYPPPPSYGGPPGPPGGGYGGPTGYGYGPPPPGPPPPQFGTARPGYGESEFGRLGPEYGAGYGRPDQEYEKPRHGRKKHGGDDSSGSDSDEEKKQRHHHHRHW